MTRLRIPPRSISERIQELTTRADSLEKQLMQSQRLATLGTLSMMLAHEINNQLMTVINRADLALSSGHDETMERALDKILASSEMSSSMIRNMMGFAQASESEVHHVSAGQMVEDTLNLMARKPEKDGIELRRDYDDTVCIEGAPVELMQVLLNLIMNAVQAMADHGGGMLTLRTYRDDDFAAIDISDTGPGIDSEALEQIFDPFFTTKKGSCGSGGGTGLGLYISRSLARRHGGDIAVTSSRGAGATFTVLLPFSEA
jgi:signal transduction histidine kinase